MNYWDRIREYLRARISEESYDNWLSGTSFAELSGDTLFVSVPDRGTRAWLEREFATLVKAAIDETGLPVRQVAYEPVPARNVQEQAITTVENSDPDSGVGSLNPKFTFDSFTRTRTRIFLESGSSKIACPWRTVAPSMITAAEGLHPLLGGME